jgi:acetyl esterase/lipase
MHVTLAVFASLLFFLLPATAAAHADPSEVEPLTGEEIPLWPGDAPGSEGLPRKETITERSRDPSRHDRIITGIVQPSLRMHRPAEPNGAAVIIAPGGAYQRIVIDKEGLDIAEWLNSLGVTTFVLTYRLPAEGHRSPADIPLADSQRAMRVLRSRAESLRIDAGRIGIIGFSAGGHLAGSLAAYHGATVYPPVDAADRLNARPDFAILVYPAVGLELVRPETLARYPGLREVISGYPLEDGVSGSWPPTFLLHAADDSSVPAEGSVRLFSELRAAGVPAELHVFNRGGHGFGIKHAEGPVAGWPLLCGEWLRHLGVLRAPASGDGRQPANAVLSGDTGGPTTGVDREGTG